MTSHERVGGVWVGAQRRVVRWMLLGVLIVGWSASPAQDTPPAPPFPDCGADATPDGLSCHLGRACE